jgi:MFS family permease
VTIDTPAPLHFSTRQWLILLILLGAGFMLAIDYSILNVALPTVGAGVGLGLSGFPWIISAFALTAAGFTLLFGRLADLFGRRKLFLSAMALLASGFTVGSLVGGTLVSYLSWRAAFFINVPVALVILLVTPFLIGESRVPNPGEAGPAWSGDRDRRPAGRGLRDSGEEHPCGHHRRAAAGHVPDHRAALASAARPGTHPQAAHRLPSPSVSRSWARSPRRRASGWPASTSR